MNKDLKHYIYLFGGVSFEIPLRLLSVFVLARLIGPEGMGKWAMAMSAHAFIHLVLFNWMYTPLVRFGREEWHHQRHINNTWASQWPFLLSAFVFSGVIIYFFKLGWFQKIFNLSSAWSVPVFLFVIATWISLQTKSFLQIREKMKKLAFIPPLLLVLVIGFYSGVSFLPAATDKVMVAFLGTAILTIVVWGIISILEGKKYITNWVRPKGENLKQFLTFSWPLIPGMLISYFWSWGNQLLLNTYYDARTVGLYQAVIQTFQLFSTAAGPLSTILLPRLIGRSLEDETSVLRYIEQVIPTLMIFWCITVLGISCVLPQVFLRIYGTEFMEALPLLSFFTLVFPGVFITHAYTILFPLKNRLAWSVLWQGLTVVVSLSTSYFLFPILGAKGAIFGSIIGYLLIQMLYMFDNHRFFKISLKKIMLPYVIILISTFVYIPLEKTVVSLSLWFILALAVFLMFVRYFDIANSNVIKRLFHGRLEKIGNTFRKILIKRTTAS